MNSYASKASSQLLNSSTIADLPSDPFCCSLSCHKKFTVDFESHKQFVYLHKLSLSLVGVGITSTATTTNEFILVYGTAGGPEIVQ